MAYEYTTQGYTVNDSGGVLSSTRLRASRGISGAK